MKELKTICIENQDNKKIISHYPLKINCTNVSLFAPYLLLANGYGTFYSLLFHPRKSISP